MRGGSFTGDDNGHGSAGEPKPSDCDMTSASTCAACSWAACLTALSYASYYYDFEGRIIYHTTIEMCILTPLPALVNDTNAIIKNRLIKFL